MTLPTGFGGLGGADAAGPSDSILLGLTVAALFSLFYGVFVLRPRTKGGQQGPPIVTSSPVSSLPVVGTIVEFGKSPVKMVQRCYEEYGPVFTVPVSCMEILLQFYHTVPTKSPYRKQTALLSELHISF